METIKVGRYEVIVALVSDNYYDVLLLDEKGTVVRKSTGCVGPKSAEYWKKYWIKRSQKLEILKHDLDLAYYNLMCYSANYAMTVPKTSYREEWQHEHDKVGLLESWIKELTEA